MRLVPYFVLQLYSASSREGRQKQSQPTIQSHDHIEWFDLCDSSTSITVAKTVFNGGVVAEEFRQFFPRNRRTLNRN